MREAATADVLKAISRSTFDLQTVLDALIEAAARLCGAKQGVLRRLEGEHYALAATYGIKPEWRDLIAGHRNTPGRGTLVGRVALEKRTLQIPDVLADPEFLNHETARVVGFRAIIGTPLLRDGEPIGFMSLHKETPGPFAAKQVQLFETFANQAVIAIENTRLFEEVQARTRELTETLEYQTAISDILNVISRSPTNVQPVLDAVGENAARLCDADNAVIYRLESDHLRQMASYGQLATTSHPPEGNRIDRQTVSGRAAFDRQTVHIRDLSAEDIEFPQGSAHARRDGHRTTLATPLLREGVPLGVILIRRMEVRFFSERQVKLLETFADQAAIAIRNVGLFQEVQARNRDLTALGEVSQAVNSSLELDKVLPTILEHACALSDASGGGIHLFDKATGEFHLEVGRNTSDEYIAHVRAKPIRLGETVLGKCVERREAMQIADLATAPPHPILDLLIRSGVRAVLAVPLLLQSEVIGGLVVRRNQPGSFSPETIRLLEAFAAQSAIAIENARLFEEIAQKSRELEIASQHKSQFVANMSHELRTPLAAILGYAELMQEGFYEPLGKKSSDALTRIRSNGKHLLGLINTVLDIAKIESGQFSLNIAEYAIDSMVETVRWATASLAETKMLALKTEVAKKLPIGLGDEQRLTQVLLNLVGNAIKFTDAGEVRITASAANGHFAVAVADTGPGIPAEEQTRVFEQFHQVDSSNTKAKGGTGLGLAIAKQIVEMHGGRIWVESTPGHGATFQMELPIRAEIGRPHDEAYPRR